ncbi:MAG: hypothetical protein K6B70_04845 [Clostridia bacterium]|nr:hypothetical protein [Clostridia bacterium]
MLKKVKSFGCDVLHFSFFRFLFETIPYTIMLVLICSMFHKSGMEIGTADNPEIAIHTLVEILVAVFYHLFVEISMHDKGYYISAPKDDKLGRAANFFSIMLHGVVIMIIAFAFLAKCKN